MYYIYCNGVPVHQVSFEGEPVWPGIPIPAGDGAHASPIDGANLRLGALLDSDRPRPEAGPKRP